jgi:hypothetical protein
VPAGASEVGDESRTVGRVADRQIREIEARRPALGPFLQHDQVIDAQTETQLVVQESRGLIVSEREVGRPQLEESRPGLACSLGEAVGLHGLRARG